MCWKGAKTQPTVAGNDISVFKIVYKCVDGVLRSAYQRFTYNIGTVYKEPPLKIKSLPIVPSYHYIVNEGFHSYSPKCIIRAFTNTVYILTDHGMPLDDLSRNSYMVKANCIIPQGSEYLLNDKGEYVSNSIKIINTETICVGNQKLAIYK